MLLVTGGAGFVGSHVVQAALDAGERVRVLDDLSTGDKRNVPDAVELIEGDVADPEAVNQALEGVERVAHLAAHRAVPRSLDDPLATDRANTAGTLCILEGARRQGVKRVVLTSSSSVYGAAATRPTAEDTPPQPRSPYAVSKLAGEHYARVYAELFGLSTVSLRIFNVYGPGQPPDGPYAQLVPRCMAALFGGPPLVIDGDGTQSRDLVYVGDVAAAFLAALGGDATGPINIGTGRAVSVLDVVDAARRVSGAPTLPASHGPQRPGDVPHTCADVTRAAQALNWRAEVSLDEGLARTAAAFAGAD
jgi:UDP-glucose 4-epimerase